MSSQDSGYNALEVIEKIAEMGYLNLGKDEKNQSIVLERIPDHNLGSSLRYYACKDSSLESVYFQVFAYCRRIYVALRDGRDSVKRGDAFRKRMMEILKKHKSVLARENNDRVMHKKTVGRIHAKDFPEIVTEVTRLMRDVYDLFSPLLKNQDVLSALQSDNLTGVESLEIPDVITASEIIVKLKNDEESFELENGRLQWHGYYYDDTTQCVKYLNTKLIGDEEHGVYYGVFLDEGRLSVQLHDERDTPWWRGELRKVASKNGFDINNNLFGCGKLSVTCGELVLCGRELDVIMGELRTRLQKLYNVFEPVLQKYSEEGENCSNDVAQKVEKCTVNPVPVEDDACIWRRNGRNEEGEDEGTTAIVFAEKLLKIPLRIPSYQRPYKWTKRNVLELLKDIETEIRHSRSLRYRLGTVILHEDKEKDSGRTIYNVVDGQQRLITLSLIYCCLSDDNKLGAPFSDEESCKMLGRSNDSLKNLRDNLAYIKAYFENDENLKRDFCEAFKNRVQVVLFKVRELDEAFQLFDSQNSRGRPLDPHHLLKAFHLREMQNARWKMESAVRTWDKLEPWQLRELFGRFLFPINNWSRCRKTWAFSERDIDVFKGIRSVEDYPFQRRVHRAMPEFQIGEDFTAGEYFFEMVSHYFQMKEYLLANLKSGHLDISGLSDLLDEQSHWSTGFKHARKLFYCVALAYFDRFGNLDPRALLQLSRWAFMVRIDVPSHLSARTINKYAVGESGSKGYTNAVPVFARIREARSYMEIVNLDIILPDKEAMGGESRFLLKVLRNMTVQMKSEVR